MDVYDSDSIENGDSIPIKIGYLTKISSKYGEICYENSYYTICKEIMDVDSGIKYLVSIISNQVFDMITKKCIGILQENNNI